MGGLLGHLSQEDIECIEAGVHPVIDKHYRVREKIINKNKKILFEMTRQQALEQGLLVCENCGYPENNHFDHGPCAHDNRCKQYKETAKVGKIVKKEKRK
jgi:hypothetical protein